MEPGLAVTLPVVLFELTVVLGTAAVFWMLKREDRSTTTPQTAAEAVKIEH